MNAAAGELDAGGARRLKITEIFHSLQGEADTVGFPTVFVRLTGCPLRCQFCDTAYAFHGGEWRTIDEVLANVAQFGLTAPPRYVCVTGGEPLAQKNCLPLLTAPLRCRLSRVPRNQRRHAARRRGCARDPRGRREDAGVGRGAAQSLRRSRAAAARGADQVRDLRSRATTSGAAQKVSSLKLDRALHRCCSRPSAEQLPARELADWILADRLPVRFQLQLHKVLWGNVPGK